MSATKHIASVTFITVSEILGGGELFTLRLAAALGSETDAGIAGVPGTPVVEEAARRGIRVQSLPLGRKLGRRTALRNAAGTPLARHRLHSFLEQLGREDWVIFQYSWEKLLWNGRSGGGRVAVIEHGPPPSGLMRLPPTRRSIQTTLRKCDALFAASVPAADATKRLSGRSPRLLLAGVYPAAIAAGRREASRVRTGLGIDADTPLVAFAGRLTANKGVFELLEAVARHPQLHLLLLGRGPAEQELGHRAQALAGRVRLLGRVDDVLPYLAAADATGLLTRDPGEGRPQLAVESLAVGTPVLGNARSPAMTALAAEGHAGLCLVDAADPAGVDAGLARVLRAERAPADFPSWNDQADELLSTLAAGR